MRWRRKQDRPLIELGLERRTYNVLMRAGIDSEDALRRAPVDGLRALYGMGRKSLSDALHAVGREREIPLSPVFKNQVREIRRALAASKSLREGDVGDVPDAPATADARQQELIDFLRGLRLGFEDAARRRADAA